MPPRGVWDRDPPGKLHALRLLLVASGAPKMLELSTNKLLNIKIISSAKILSPRPPPPPPPLLCETPPVKMRLKGYRLIKCLFTDWHCS